MRLLGRAVELTEARDTSAVPPVVVRNDEWTWRDVFNRVYKDRAFDNIVISPGPGSPACPADIGVWANFAFSFALFYFNLLI